MILWLFVLAVEVVSVVVLVFGLVVGEWFVVAVALVVFGLCVLGIVFSGDDAV